MGKTKTTIRKSARALLESSVITQGDTQMVGGKIFYRGLPLVKKNSDGSVSVSMANLPTHTIKRRINDILVEMGVNARIWHEHNTLVLLVDGEAREINQKSWYKVSA